MEGRAATFRIAARSRDLSGFDASEPFAVGYPVVDTSRTGAIDRLVLLPCDAAVDAVVEMPETTSVPLREGLDPVNALLVAPLSVALSFWEALHLELGDAAVLTSGSPLSRLAGQVALWRGGCPVVELGPPGTVALPDITHIDWADPEAAARLLTEVTCQRPGFAAVDLSGRAEVLDILLETMPRWSRLLLAGPAGRAITIDYYKNVHRKGAVIATTVGEPTSLFHPLFGAAAIAQVGRAIHVLQNPTMAAQCRSALGVGPRTAELTTIAV